MMNDFQGLTLAEWIMRSTKNNRRILLGEEFMKLDHISITATPDGDCYRIRAELRGIPGEQWQDGLLFVWYNSPYYLCKKSELILEENEILLFLEDSCDLQKAIDTLNQCVLKADKMVRNTGITYMSSYRKAMN